MLVGAGAVACVACCAGPVLGFLAAIGLGTAIGVLLWGVGAVVGGALLVAYVMVRRRRRTVSCEAVEAVPVVLRR